MTPPAELKKGRTRRREGEDKGAKKVDSAALPPVPPRLYQIMAEVVALPTSSRLPFSFAPSRETRFPQ